MLTVYDDWESKSEKSEEKNTASEKENGRISLKGAMKETKMLCDELRKKGLTLEEYRAALLSTFMYLDFFTNEDDGTGYKVRQYKRALTRAKTLEDILLVLEKCPLYMNKRKAGKSTRYLYYSIMKDALVKDPGIGKFELSFMSRTIHDATGKKIFNEGTNAITFIDPENKDIYIAFMGTSKGEWMDNGRRFGVKDIASMTIQMQETIAYIDHVGRQMQWKETDHIVVTGHSQGGNDAQLAILLSQYGSLIKRCYSFDGEGHSPNLCEDIKQTLGQEEYEVRRKRMYSICGENDFINQLGEKVIPDENTRYVLCQKAFVDFGRNHDIVSMFCQKRGRGYHYGAVINTTVGVTPKFWIKYTTQLWDEMNKVSYEKRIACQDAIMYLVELSMSNGKQKQGMHGEKAALKDYKIFIRYGIPMFVDALQHMNHVGLK